jgi:hypothetical protein
MLGFDAFAETSVAAVTPTPARLAALALLEGVTLSAAVKSVTRAKGELQAELSGVTLTSRGRVTAEIIAALVDQTDLLSGRYEVQDLFAAQLADDQDLAQGVASVDLDASAHLADQDSLLAPVRVLIETGANDFLDEDDLLRGRARVFDRVLPPRDAFFATASRDERIAFSAEASRQVTAPSDPIRSITSPMDRRRVVVSTPRGG